MIFQLSDTSPTKKPSAMGIWRSRSTNTISAKFKPSCVWYLSCNNFSSVKVVTRFGTLC